MLTAQGVRWVADITHAYRKKHNELCTQARIQTDRERDYESCRCVRQICLLGAHNIASRVSWCFTPSQPARLYQGDIASRHKNNKQD